MQHNVTSARSLDSITPNVDALRATRRALRRDGARATRRSCPARAEAAVADLKSDKRVAQVIQTGEALASAVVEAVQERVGKAATTAASTAAGASAFVRSQRSQARTGPSRPPRTRLGRDQARDREAGDHQDRAGRRRPPRPAAKKTTAAKKTAAKATAAKTAAAKKTAPAKAAAAKKTAPAKKATAAKKAAAAPVA